MTFRGSETMTLIVEDGTGRTDAESYASVEYADDYHAKRGNAAWGPLPTETKEVKLRLATEYMVTTFRSYWQGWRTVPSQALDHPRVDLWRDDRDKVPDNIVAPEVLAVCCDLALISLSGPLVPTATSRGRKSVKVGPISVVYDDALPTGAAFLASVRKLSIFLTPMASGGMVDLVRS